MNPALRSDLLVLTEEGSDSAHGYPFDGRPLNALLEYGLLSVDKPAGPTSHEVVAWVRRLLGVSKAGHSGTLDPGVTGVLPIGLGEATKALSVLLLGAKEYVAVARLHDPVDEAKLRDVLSLFTGEIFQRPPQRSSVKRVTRTRRIYELELLERHGNLLLLRILCEAGTYVRKLVYDMGEVWGPGATMVELRRTRVSNLVESQDLVRLHELAAAVHAWQADADEQPLRRLVRPVEHATVDLKAVMMRDSAVDAICHGAQLAIPGIVRLSRDIQPSELVAAYTVKGELVALMRAEMSTKQIEHAERGIAFAVERVIMRAGTYPRLWRARPKTETARAAAASA